MPIPVNIKTTNLELNETIAAYAQKQFSKLDKFVDDADSSAHADIELAKTVVDQRNGEIYRAEINLQTAGNQFYASSEQIDLYTAIDEVRDEVLREIKKTKDKHRDLLRQGARKIKNMLRRQ